MIKDSGKIKEGDVFECGANTVFIVAEIDEDSQCCETFTFKAGMASERRTENVARLYKNKFLFNITDPLKVVQI